MCSMGILHLGSDSSCRTSSGSIRGRHVPSVPLLRPVWAWSSLQPAGLVVALGESRVFSFVSSLLLFWCRNMEQKAVFNLCSGHSLCRSQRRVDEGPWAPFLCSYWASKLPAADNHREMFKCQHKVQFGTKALSVLFNRVRVGSLLCCRKLYCENILIN